jgi:hypothetical protein
MKPLKAPHGNKQSALPDHIGRGLANTRDTNQLIENDGAWDRPPTGQT